MEQSMSCDPSNFSKFKKESIGEETPKKFLRISEKGVKILKNRK